VRRRHRHRLVAAPQPGGAWTTTTRTWANPSLPNNFHARTSTISSSRRGHRPSLTSSSANTWVAPSTRAFAASCSNAASACVRTVRFHSKKPSRARIRSVPPVPLRSIPWCATSATCSARSSHARSCSRIGPRSEYTIASPLRPRPRHRVRPRRVRALGMRSGGGHKGAAPVTLVAQARPPRKNPRGEFCHACDVDANGQRRDTRAGHDTGTCPYLTVCRKCGKKHTAAFDCERR
jgi:hypothetical protein